MLNEFSIGICAGGTCTGPVLGFQQDVYFGLDMVAVAAAKNVDVMGAVDAVGGSFAMGAYIQVSISQSPHSVDLLHIRD